MCAQEFKAGLRRRTLAARDSMTIEARIEASLMIDLIGFEALRPLSGEIVSGFWPMRSEVDIRPLMFHLAETGARLCLPVVVDRTRIVFRELIRGAEFIDAGFGTFGPGPQAAELDPTVMLVPLAAFDRMGNRIGYGAGHYDRAIARLHEKGQQPRLIGVAFDVQEVEQVPHEAHDVPLSAILTQSGFYQMPQNRS